MFSRIVKYLGFGLAAVGAQNAIEEESANTFNLATSIVGSFLYFIGTYCEHKCRSTQSPPTTSPSTAIISNLLHHASGYGIIGAITNLARRQDTVSANVVKLGRGCILRIAITELEKTLHNPPPPLKWEKSRFFLLIASDYISSFGMQHLMNWESWSPLSIVAFPIGLLLSIGEFIYGYKNDEKIDLKSALDRRLFKLSSVMSLVFTVSDIAKNQMDRNMIADDTYSIITGALLFAVTVKLWQMEKIPHPAALTHITVSHEPLLSNENKAMALESSYRKALKYYYANSFEDASKKSLDVVNRGRQIISSDSLPSPPLDKTVINSLIGASVLLGHIAMKTSKNADIAKLLYGEALKMCAQIYGAEHSDAKKIEDLIQNCKPSPTKTEHSKQPQPPPVQHDYEGPRHRIG